MGVLSDDQFTELGNTEGASRRLSDRAQVKDTDPANHRMYAVSYPSSMGHEEAPAHPIVRQQVHDHIDRMLADPTLSANPASMQGAWPSGGKVYLDASRMVEGRRNAVSVARAGQQIAVRDMSRSRDVVLDRRNISATDTHKVVGNRQVGYTLEPRRDKAGSGGWAVDLARWPDSDQPRPGAR